MAKVTRYSGDESLFRSLPVCSQLVPFMDDNHNDNQIYTAPYGRMVGVWFSGNALVLINAVALHRAQLVLGWVTAFG